jgi:hypothetical protein
MQVLIDKLIKPGLDPKASQRDRAVGQSHYTPWSTER